MATALYEFFIHRNYIQFSFQLIVCVIPFVIGMKKRGNFVPGAVAAVIGELILSGIWK